MNAFQMRFLREDANLIREDVFKHMLVICFSDMSQLHRLLQLKCVKDWVGWQEVKAILGL